MRVEMLSGADLYSWQGENLKVESQKVWPLLVL
jgi:hypothetical protein